MNAHDLQLQDRINAEINTRHRRDEAKLRDEIAARLIAADEAKDKAAQEREDRGEAGIATYIAGLTAKSSLTFYDRVFTIDLAHRDPVMRDIAIVAMERLMLYVTKAIRAGVVTAENIGKAGGTPTNPTDHRWVENLLNNEQWLRPAYVRGLLTVTDLTGEPHKAMPAPAKFAPVKIAAALSKTVTPVGAPVETEAEADAVVAPARDNWLAGSTPITDRVRAARRAR